jgi:N6-adenosine-specific RNA methylase IME4
MLLEEICALPVGDIAHDDAVLFMWSTAPKLAESMQVIEAWGFNYRTGMVWAKDKIGLGYYVRNQHEHLLICKRGEIPHPPESARCSSLIDALSRTPRIGWAAATRWR